MAIQVKALSKGHQRKLTALRKSLGKDIADKAFAAWQKAQGTAKPTGKSDPVAKKLLSTLKSLEKDKSINLGNNGYSVKRAKGKGGGGFVVERIEKSAKKAAAKAKKAAAPKAKKATAPKAKKKAGKRRAKKAAAAQKTA